ncbi:MAG: Asp23/Gls24 family envelope stress response protein [Oscillibacter sp.]|nr:Asp23/Gls24 family envelope stress response protein [Oscillibacter sp.]
MGENKEYMTHPEELGSIHISEEVLASLAAGAAADVEGISGLMNVAAKKSGTRGVRLVVDEDGAVIDVYILIRYGYAIPEVAGKIQSAISGAIESMTGFSVKAVNVHVGGVSFQ